MIALLTLASLGCFAGAAQTSPVPSPSFGPGYRLKMPEPTLETLPNGLTVAWFLNDSLPVLDLALLVRSGYRDDPLGKSGLAELLAATLDRGNAGVPATEVAREIERLGASRSIAVEDDALTVSLHGLSMDGNELLSWLAKLALKPDFQQKELDREHARIMDRWSHVVDEAGTLASLLSHRAIAGGTSYGRGGYLSNAEFRNLKREDVLSFHRAHFTPTNSVLLVVGRADRKTLGARISAELGGWSGERPKHVGTAFADPRLNRRKGEILFIERAGTNQAAIRIGFQAPLITSEDHYALTVANALLGETFNSRLNAVIRDRLGLTYSIASGFSYSLELGRFGIATSSRNDAVPQILDRTLDILESLGRGDISEEEVALAKEYLVGSFPVAMSTLGAVAARWLTGYVFALGPGFLSEFPTRISAVTRDQVAAAAKRHLAGREPVIVVSGHSEVLKALSRAGKRKVRRVEASGLL